MLKGTKVLFRVALALMHLMKKPLMEAKEFCKLVLVLIKPTL
jgi:hypothetical protein